jgi:integrase/recombinase XerD
MLVQVYDRLRAEDQTLKADPKRWGEREIHAFVDLMRRNRLGIAYQTKLLQYLRLLLRYLGNPVLDRMKEAREDLPRPARKRLSAPSERDVENILHALESLGGWRGEWLSFAVRFYYGTGVRVKELRLADLKDLDLRTMHFVIRHPKGEGVWADAGRSVRIPESLRIPIMDYLAARSRRCESMGLDPIQVEPLIPAWDGHFYSEAGWVGVRCKAFRELGLRYNFRELRPAHAQRLKDRGIAIEKVSQRLGHSSTVTTEAFYARIKSEAADDECAEIWDKPMARN